MGSNLSSHTRARPYTLEDLTVFFNYSKGKFLCVCVGEVKHFV